MPRHKSTWSLTEVREMFFRAFPAGSLRVNKIGACLQISTGTRIKREPIEFLLATAARVVALCAREESDGEDDRQWRAEAKRYGATILGYARKSNRIALKYVTRRGFSRLDTIESHSYGRQSVAAAGGPSARLKSQRVRLFGCHPTEPQTGPQGTLSWTVDVCNEATKDDFTLALKELEFKRGETVERRPYAMLLAGHYPRALDGLCLALSLDMRVIDPAWIGKKFRELLNYSEPKGDFYAPAPMAKHHVVYPSTVT